MGLQGESWFLTICRSLCAAIDSLIFGLLRWIIYGIFDLANLTTNSNILGNIYSRIYVILGIFMAFKLSFSFFQYIVDPESMGPKSEKGVSKLLFRVGTMLAALLLLPNLLFGTNGSEGLLTRAQNAFLPTLPKILLGVNDVSGGMSVTGNSSGSVSQTIDEAADSMTASLLQAFFAPSEQLDKVCGEGTYENIPPVDSIESFVRDVNITCDVKGTGFLGIGAKKYYKYSYLCLVSTIVSILFVIMFLGITIDVAKRVFKLIILEIIAPIPIMSLIDPKSSKDGAFSKWSKNLISTFLDIFFKIGLVYIVLVFIQLIVNNGLFTNMPSFRENPIRALYLRIFLILALIFFAKEAPTFIKESLGIKGDKGMGTGLGAAAGFIGGAIGGRGISGAFAGAVTGAEQGGDPKGHAFQAGRDLAGQIRTGDSKWKGGLANGMQRGLSRHSGRVQAERNGVTDQTLKNQKNRMQQDQNIADRFRLQYEAAVQDGTANEEMRNDLARYEANAAESKSTYEKMDKMAEAFGIKLTPQEEKRRNRSGVYRAGHWGAEKGRMGIAWAGGKIRGSVDRRENSDKIGSRMVRNIDSAVQQHRYNEANNNKRVFDSATDGGTVHVGGQTGDALTHDIAVGAASTVTRNTRSSDALDTRNDIDSRGPAGGRGAGNKHDPGTWQKDHKFNGRT